MRIRIGEDAAYVAGAIGFFFLVIAAAIRTFFSPGTWFGGKPAEFGGILSGD
jgi:hypothetical protein